MASRAGGWRMGEIEVVVRAARQLTQSIRELVLVSAQDTALPSWEPGAHLEIDVRLPDGEGASRAYSLIGGTDSGDDPANTYRIAVERQPEGRGGSRYLHDAVAIG